MPPYRRLTSLRCRHCGAEVLQCISDERRPEQPRYDALDFAYVCSGCKRQFGRLLRAGPVRWERN